MAGQAAVIELAALIRSVSASSAVGIAVAQLQHCHTGRSSLAVLRVVHANEGQTDWTQCASTISNGSVGRGKKSAGKFRLWRLGGLL